MGVGLAEEVPEPQGLCPQQHFKRWWVRQVRKASRGVRPTSWSAHCPLAHPHAMRKTKVLTGGQRHVPRLSSPQNCELEKLLLLVAYPVYGLLSHRLLRSSTSVSSSPRPSPVFTPPRLNHLPCPTCPSFSPYARCS